MPHNLEISKAITDLTELKTLVIGTKDSPEVNFELPEEVGLLEKLKALEVYKNNLQELPKSIKKLQNLEKIIIADNKLPCIPQQVMNLSKLEYLSLRYNDIHYILTRA